ncbi:MAG: helix-turn-helix domain-containing protein [Chromatiaceae bacterium]|nr:helix-turn-helix domain-containing protein [Chromatiaceae bacterium]
MKTPPRHEALLSIQGVAAFLNLSTKTVRRLIDRGNLPAFKLGSQWRIHPRDLEDFVFAQRQRSR